MAQKENKSRFSMRKQKSYLTAGVIALMAVVAIAGICYRQASKNAEPQDAVIMAENEWTEEEGKTDGTDTAELAAADTEGTDAQISAADADGSDNGTAVTDGQDVSADAVNTSEIAGAMENAETAASVSEPHFSETDTLGWPISGNIILNYSMDQTVYFATLDQYKYNPALVIEASVNDKVLAAAAGTVASVEVTEETGSTVTVDIGDGYQLIYGQLKEVQVSPDDAVEKGELIGFVSEPTKYYSVEGSNLYFAMTKDGEPVNPMNYLE